MKKNFSFLLENKKQEKLKEKIKASSIIITCVYYFIYKIKIKKYHQSINKIQLFFNVNKYKINKKKRVNKISKIQALFKQKKKKINI